MESRLLTPEKLFLEFALYDSITLEANTCEHIYKSLFTSNSLDVSCPDCATKSIFRAIDNRPRYEHAFGFEEYNPKDWFASLHGNELIKKDFTCSRNDDHKISFLFVYKNGSLIKVGQYPAVATLAEYEIKSFRKILGGASYGDFNRAIGLNSHGIGAGAIVYLRRVFENFVIKRAVEEARKTPSWDQEQYERSRMREKIDLLKSHLPEFITQNKELYSVLSVGIHELSEEECLKIFPVLRSCIVYILTEIKNKHEEEQRKSEMIQALKNIHKSY